MKEKDTSLVAQIKSQREVEKRLREEKEAENDKRLVEKLKKAEKEIKDLKDQIRKLKSSE